MIVRVQGKSGPEQRAGDQQGPDGGPGGTLGPHRFPQPTPGNNPIATMVTW